MHTEGLSKRYGSRQALTDANLTVPAGRVVGLVGPNGAGKSTLLNLASGMITPTSGTIEVLDPLARRAFLQSLMEFVAELEVSVILSSHLLGDLERVCDHLIVLTASRVQLADEVEDLLAAHYRLIAPRGDLDELPPGIEVIQGEHTARQSTLIVHDTTGTLPHHLPNAEHLDLEDMVLAYLTRAANASAGATVHSYAEQPLEAQ